MLLVWVLVLWLRLCAATTGHLHPTLTTVHHNSNNISMGRLSRSRSSLLAVLLNKSALQSPLAPHLQNIAIAKRWPQNLSSKIRRKREIDDNSYNNINNGLSYEDSRYIHNNNNNRHNPNDDRESALRNDNTNLNNNDYNSNTNNQNAVSGSRNRSNNNYNYGNNNGHQNQPSPTTTTTTPAITTTTSPATNAVSSGALDGGLAPAADEVLWGALCSPRFVLVLRHHDVALRCEVWAPLGTIIRWRKNSQTLRTDLYHNEGMENSVDRDAQFSQPRGHASGRQNVHSFFFLDCASRAHRGTFELLVVPPSGRAHSRYFSVFIVEDESRETGLMCQLVPRDRLLLPRIHAFSRVVTAPLGTALTLPCHYQGDFMAVTWSFENRRTNLTWTSSGDLLIPAVTPSHRGIYVCTLQSTLLPQQEQLRDSILTFVQPRPVD